MPDNIPSTNGWPEYKRTVIQQLEYLTSEVKELRAVIGKIEKNIASLVTRDKLEIDIMSVNARREVDIAALYEKREIDLTTINKRRDDNTILTATRINELVVDFAAHRGEEEKGRRIWGIVITAITITINIAALVVALIFLK